MKTPILLSLSAIILLTLFGCSNSTKSPDLILINKTGYDICKVQVNEDVSIPLPLTWENELHFSKLRDGERLEMHISRHEPRYMMSVTSCDKNLVGSWYGLNRGDTVTMTYDRMIDRRTPIPTSPPSPTRTPAIVTLVNGSNHEICDLSFAVRREPYQFGANVLAGPMRPGEQIVLHESSGEIKWAVQVIRIRNCAGNEYITNPFTAEGVVTITLSGTEKITINRAAEK